MCSGLCICPLLLLSVQAAVSFPSLPKDTHHYGANHRAFDHPPQSCVVIHIPAAERQKDERLSSVLGCLANGDSPTVALFPCSSLRTGWLEKEFSGMLQTGAQLWFFQCPGPSLLESPVGSWARAVFPLQDCEGATSPSTAFLPSLKGKQDTQSWTQPWRGPLKPCTFSLGSG